MCLGKQVSQGIATADSQCWDSNSRSTSSSIHMTRFGPTELPAFIDLPVTNNVDTKEKASGCPEAPSRWVPGLTVKETDDQGEGHGSLRKVPQGIGISVVLVTVVLLTPGPAALHGPQLGSLPRINPLILSFHQKPPSPKTLQETKLDQLGEARHLHTALQTSRIWLSTYCSVPQFPPL